MKLSTIAIVAALMLAIFELADSASLHRSTRTRGHHRRNRNRYQKMILVRTSEEVQNRSAADSPDSTTTYDDIYSEWSRWKRCNRKCKQVRTRVCKAPQVCGTMVLKEERGCNGDRCLLATNLTSQEESAGGQRGRERSSEFRVLYHLQSMIYSKWSEWSPCTKTCRTRRYRACEISEICGSNIIQEDALCYVEGSPCEEFYKKKKRRPEGPNSGPSTGGNGIESEASTVVVGNKSVLATATGSGFIDEERCGRPMVKDSAANLRIIGGREATRGVWPWQVVILNHDLDPFCGGTLITPQFVLTAAHCVRRRLYVRAGEHDLMSEEGPEQQIRVEASFKHPEYDPETVDNDIALLRLRKPLKLNKYVSTACLPMEGLTMDDNELGTILGWGKRKKNAHFGTDVLHQASVPIASTHDCRQVYSEYFISQNMVCAGFKRGRVDSCAGDSGGPLLFEKDGRWFVYGITSFGEGCGQRGKYGIYAKVPNFVTWIRETIER